MARVFAKITVVVTVDIVTIQLGKELITECRTVQ